MFLLIFAASIIVLRDAKKDREELDYTARTTFVIMNAGSEQHERQKARF